MTIRLIARESITSNQGPDFDDMPSFFPCGIHNAIQYTRITLGYGAQAFFRHFVLFLSL